MRLRWEPPRDGLARGFSDEGYQLAQVARIETVEGTPGRWRVLLLHPEGELFEQFDAPDDAMAAAEAALDSNHKLPSGEDG